MVAGDERDVQGFAGGELEGVAYWSSPACQGNRVFLRTT